MKILRIAMNGEEHPFYTMSNAFKEVFGEDNVNTIWWEEFNNNSLNELIIDKVTNNDYDAVFLQVQKSDVISEAAAQAISENSLGFNWTGDVRTNIDWYIKMGKYWVTLFTNMHDVKTMRNLGLRADYLQIGYDHRYYHIPGVPVKCHDNIVFCGTHYYDKDFPLTQYRVDIANHLKQEFGDKFNIYGGNWKRVLINSEYESVGNQDEASIYQSCAIAINCSHFNYSRYSSDRIFREMACGAFVLSHQYIDYDMDFKEGEHLVTFQDIPDMIKKCHYYLNNPEERKRIGANAAKLVSNTAKWTHRMQEFKALIVKYVSSPYMVDEEAVHSSTDLKTTTVMQELTINVLGLGEGGLVGC